MLLFAFQYQPFFSILLENKTSMMSLMRPIFSLLWWKISPLSNSNALNYSLRVSLLTLWSLVHYSIHNYFRYTHNITYYCQEFLRFAIYNVPFYIIDVMQQNSDVTTNYNWIVFIFLFNILLKLFLYKRKNMPVHIFRHVIVILLNKPVTSFHINFYIFLTYCNIIMKKVKKKELYLYKCKNLYLNILSNTKIYQEKYFTWLINLCFI